MKRYIRYYEQPGFKHSRLEFGLMDPGFAKKIISLIPDDWEKSKTMKDANSGRLFIHLKHHSGLFWNLVDIVNSYESHGEVSMECRKFKNSTDRIFYKTLT